MKNRLTKSLYIAAFIFLFLIFLFSFSACSNNKSYKISFNFYNEDEIISFNIKGKSIVELPPEPQREGYIFEGWYFDNEIFNKKFFEDYFINNLIDRDIQLYAKWSIRKCLVTFKACEAIHVKGDVIQIIDYGSQATAPIFIKKGHVFVGWDKDLESIKSDIVINALFAPKKYKITFNDEDDIVEFIAIYGQTLSANLIAPINNNYKFGGYYSLPKGKGTKYIDAQMQGVRYWDIAEDTTLYPKWYNEVFFDKQNGMNGSDNVEAVYGEAMPNASAPSRALYTFLGYFTEKEGKGIQYYDKNMVSLVNWEIISGITLYAHWKEAQYDIIFDKQGGYGGSNSVVLKYGESMPQASAPKKAGYIFKGYFGEKENHKMYYDSNMLSQSIWNNDFGLILYAKWEMINQTQGLNYKHIEKENAYEVSGYEGMDTEIIIPAVHNGKKVVAVSNNAFDNNYSIEKVIISIGIERIGKNAFNNCILLKSLELPNTLKYIDEGAFYRCISLDNIILTENLLEISQYSFSGCSNIKNISFGSGITHIKDYAFSDCISLTDLDLPDSIVYIGNRVFENCIYLESIKLPTQLLYIDEGVFMHCSALEKINLPESLIHIGEKAFYYSGLYNIIIPSNVVYIGQEAFDSINMHNAFIQGETPFAINMNAFPINTYIFVPHDSYNAYINNIGWKKYINIYSIEDIDLEGFLIKNDMLIVYTANAEIIVVPNNISSIADSAFKGAKGKITFEENSLLTNVSQKMLDCYMGKEIVFPNSILHIEGQAFDSAVNLETIILPDNLIGIEGNGLFERNVNLKNVYLNKVEPPLADGDYNYSDINLYVPKLEDYQNHPFWQRFNVLIMP